MARRGTWRVQEPHCLGSRLRTERWGGLLADAGAEPQEVASARSGDWRPGQQSWLILCRSVWRTETLLLTAVEPGGPRPRQGIWWGSPCWVVMWQKSSHRWGRADPTPMPTPMAAAPLHPGGLRNSHLSAPWSGDHVPHTKTLWDTFEPQCQGSTWNRPPPSLLPPSLLLLLAYPLPAQGCCVSGALTWLNALILRGADLGARLHSKNQKRASRAGPGTHLIGNICFWKPEGRSAPGCSGSFVEIDFKGTAQI